MGSEPGPRAPVAIAAPRGRRRWVVLGRFERHARTTRGAGMAGRHPLATAAADIWTAVFVGAQRCRRW